MDSIEHTHPVMERHPVEVSQETTSQVQSDPPLEEQIRRKLVIDVCRIISLRQDKLDGYPVFIGSLARIFSLLSSKYGSDHIGQNAVIDSVAGLSEIEIVAKSLEQFDELAPILSRFLHGWNIKCSIMNANGDMLFKYGTEQQVHACIRLSCQPPGSILLDPQAYTIMPTDSRVKPITINAAYSDRAQLIVALNLLYNPMNFEQLKIVGNVLNGIYPNISESDVFLYNTAVAAYWDHFRQRSPAGVALPPEIVMQQTPEMAPEQEPETVTHSSLPRRPEQHALEPMLESHEFCKSLRNLKYDNPGKINLSYEKIASIFEVTSDVTGYAVSGIKQNSARRGRQGKGAGRSQLDAACRGIQRGTDKAVKVNALKRIFSSSSLTNRIIKFIEMEARHTKRHYTFPTMPYLGHAQCTLANSGNTAQQENPEFIRELDAILSEMPDEISEEDTLVDLRQHEQAFAICSVLMLKYSAYGGHYKLQTYDALMFKLAQLIKKIAQAASKPEYRDHEGVWRILPQTMLIVLSNQAKQLTFTKDTSEKILISLSETMKAACVQGDFDLSASVINILSETASCFACDVDYSKLELLFSQIRMFFHMCYNIANTVEKNSYIQTCVAHAIQKQASDVQKLMETWSSVAIPNIEIKAAEGLAHEILEANRENTEAFHKAFDDEVKQLMVAKDQQKERAWETAKANRKKQQQGSKQSAKKDVATSVVETTQETKATQKREVKWARLLSKAVEYFTLQQFSEGKNSMDLALKAAQKNIDRACIYTDCGDAQILPVKKLINHTCHLAKLCALERQRMEERSEEAQNTFGTECPDRRTARAWLCEHQLSSIESLTRLAEQFLSETEIKSVAVAINEAINFYSKALVFLKRCSSEEMREQGQFLLEIIKLDVKDLYNARNEISSAKENLAWTMKMLPQVLYHLGLYGRSAPQQGAANSASVKKNVAQKQKHWFTQFQDQFGIEATDLSALYEVRESEGDKLKELLSDINTLESNILTTEESVE